MEVKLSRGLFARQRRERERRERNKGYGINELLSNKSDTVNVLAPYKLMPDILPFMGDKRRIPRSCRECVKTSREADFKGDEHPELGIGNCFMLSNRNRNKPLQTRLFAELGHFWDRGGQPNLFKKVISADDLWNYSKFKHACEELKIKGSGVSLIVDEFRNLTLEEFVAAFGIKQIKAWMQRLCLRFGGWILSKIFNRVFDGICYHKGTVNLLKTATESGLPIFYVPLHKSSLDPILLPWILLSLGVSPLPLVLAPRNLGQGQAPFIRSISSLFGGFGISRIADRGQGYTQMTNHAAFSYMRLSILNGNSLQFALESHRSRNGKASSFVTGSQMLSTVMDMYKNKELEDAFIVPVSVSYEKLPEQEMIEHAQIEPKKCQSAGMLSLRKLLCSSLGYVRVDFCQPMRLRDFRHREPYSAPSPFNCLDFPIDAKSTTVIPARELQFDDRVGSVASLSSLYAEDDPLEAHELYRGACELADILTQHVVYDAQKASAFMSTNLLSFLLLKKFPEGTALDNLIEEMTHLREEICSRKRDVGFTGEMNVVVPRAIELLGHSIISMSRNKEGQIWVKPTFTTRSSLVLGYYANPLVQLFIREACVSTAILSLAGLSYKAMINTSFPITTSEDLLVHNSLEVAQLMKGEFILNPPCESTDSVIRQAIDDMNDFSYIYVHKKKEYRVAHDFDESDDDDFDEYDDGGINLRTFGAKSDVGIRVEKIEFVNNEDSWKYHEFLRNLLVPYLEFYRVGLTVIMQQLVAAEKPEDRGVTDVKEEIELRQIILSEAKKFLKNSKLFNAEEIITVDTARNFLNHMTVMDIIGSWSNIETEGKRMVYLTNEYAKEPAKLRRAIACIMKYITY